MMDFVLDEFLTAVDDLLADYIDENAGIAVRIVDAGTRRTPDGPAVTLRLAFDFRDLLRYLANAIRELPEGAGTGGGITVIAETAPFETRR